jgi:hypothetical protein
MFCAATQCSSKSTNGLLGRGYRNSAKGKAGYAGSVAAVLLLHHVGHCQVCCQPHGTKLIDSGPYPNMQHLLSNKKVLPQSPDTDASYSSARLSKAGMHTSAHLTVANGLYLVDAVGVSKSVEFGVKPVQQIRNLDTGTWLHLLLI